jgi:putative ubiquitin-RnfH superfamily antitoxin RatB of RatAB toxin-antitoxin module
MSDLQFQLALQTASGVVLSQHTAPAGCTVLQALTQTIMQAVVPESSAAHIDLKQLTVGVWSRSIKAGQLLQAGDRLECYLPLLADPKDARRARVNRSLTQQATKENAANRATNRAARLRREAAKPIESKTTFP